MLRTMAKLGMVAIVGPTMIAVGVAGRALERLRDGEGSRCECGGRRAYRVGDRWRCHCEIGE